MENGRIYYLTLINILTLGLITILVQPIASAGGRIEHHQITSRILGDAGQVANRELSIYLPEEYDTSGLSYPVVYLIHGGAGGTNRTFLGLGYPFVGGKGSEVRVDLIMDKLIEDEKSQPLIVAMPNMDRGGNSRALFHEDYLVQEIAPFVDANYRTIPARQGRVIAGHSRGAADALYISLAYPTVFSLVGSYASGFYRSVQPTEEPLKAHDQASFPLQFWVYVGRNDENVNLPLNQSFVDILKGLDLPHVFIVSDGGHFDIEEGLAESMAFFSKSLGDLATSTEPYDRAVTVWGEIKSEAVEGER